MSDQASKEKKQFKFTGWHFLTIMLLFYAVIITANLTMATNALNQFSGLVVKNTYVASQQFNDKVERAQAQKALNWDLDLKIAKEGVSFTLLDAEKQPIEKQLITLNLRSTITPDADMSLLLSEKTPGVYSTNFKQDQLLPRGAWLIDLTVMKDGQIKYEYEENRQIDFK